MEQRSQYDDVIIKYLSGNSNDEEYARMQIWITSSDENRQHFETLKNTWKLAALKDSLDSIDPESEWLQLEQHITIDQGAYPETFLQENLTSEKRSRRSKIYQIIAMASAAAVLIGVVIYNGGFNSHQANQNEVVTIEHAEQKQGTLAYTRHEKNNSPIIKNFLLPDGTEVALSGQSEISFQQPFPSNRRDIVLSGKAFFNVAKDKSKPFTVFSGNVSTIALGTRFTVSSFAKDKYSVVRLYEGKLLVKINYNQQRSFQHDYYLNANQELVYDNLHSTASVRRMSKNTGGSGNQPVLNEDSVSISAQSSGSWFMFNNQLLEQVFAQLEDMYHVDIKYTKKDIQHMYFIARFEKGYSLENILNQIALLNHLKITKKDDKYIVTK